MTEKGLVMVNTGNGKGKTTAALGLALRAWGDGLRVLILQFIKGNWKCGELEGMKKLGERIRLEQCGKGFTWKKSAGQEEHRQCAQETFAKAKIEMRSGKWDLIILDEINYAVRDGLLDEAQVLELIEQKPDNLHILLTGRDVCQSVIDKADMVTEMRPIKHHLENGIKAQKGIEF